MKINISNKTQRREEHREHATGGVCYPGRSRVCFLCSDEGAKIYIALTRPAPWSVKKRNETSRFVCINTKGPTERESERERAGASTHATYPGRRAAEGEKKTCVVYVLY